MSTQGTDPHWGTTEGRTGSSDDYSGPGDASGREGILALIDGAIEDYAVSGDAMRRTPEPARAERTGRVTHVSWLPAGSIADLARPTIAELSAGLDLTSHVSSVEIRGAEPHLTIIDEVHHWARSAFADIATTPAPRPEPVTLDSIMAAMRLLEPPPPRPSYVCHSDEYDRLKTDLDARGVDVGLTGSPHVPYGQVIRYTPPDPADWSSRWADAFTPFQPEPLSRAYLTGWYGNAFDATAANAYRLVAHGNAYVDPRPRRAELRAIHTAYRAKTRRRNRRNR